MGRLRKGHISLFLFGTVIAVLVLSLALLYRHDYKSFYLLRINPLEDHRLDQSEIPAILQQSDIWLLGDSRIQMWNKDLLSESGAIANLGIDGQTSEQVLYRLRSYLNIDTPNLLIVEVGINELKIIGVDKGLAPSIVNNYYENLESLLEICKDSRVELVLINIFPFGNIELTRRLVWNRYVGQTILEANQKIQSYCDGIQVHYFDAYTILSSNGRTVNREYQEDFLHLNELGYEVLSRELLPIVNNIMTNLQ
jgi:lysophospholipase L1-like esterase